MKTRTIVFTSMLSLLTTGLLITANEEQKKPYVGSKGFERLKSLVGSWEGTMDMGQGPMTITATYELTAGGSAIVETVFEGSPHEMVTIYHDNSNRELMMTHYCMLHNQPKMILKSMDETQLNFDLSADADIDVANETHMHSATIKFDGPDKMIQSWTKYDEGKASAATDIVYKRTN